MMGLAVVATVSAGEKAEVPICSKGFCEDLRDCPTPQEHALIDLDLAHQHNEFGNKCLCYCAKKDGDECDSDKQCVVGSECVITQAHAKAKNRHGPVHTGECQNKCIELMSNGDCIPTAECFTDGTTGKPYCQLRAFNCMNPIQGMTLEASRVGERNNRKVDSRCELHMDNRKIQRENPDAPLWVEVIKEAKIGPYN